MEITTNEKDGVLTVSLKGELDHHGAVAARQDIDAAISRTSPKKVVLVLDRVNFCDSSGLGLIMGRYKKALSVGATLTVADPSEAVERIIKLSGLTEIIKTERSGVL
ncbi:MAG: anti-sigma factor antagonist [Clostridia bacterium]|nr:anti-sigma factor antagonist [Clostridia bacterium]